MAKLILKDIQECITELEGGGKITTITYLKKLLAEVEAYDKRIDENRVMLINGRMRRKGVSYEVTMRPFVGRVEAVKDRQKNQWVAGFGYGVLFVLGVVAFMALMLF